MKIHGLFPTPVAMFDINRELTKKENDFILNAEYHENRGNETSLNKYILSEIELQKIKKFCLNSVEKYVDAIVKPKEKIKSFITQSWLNKTEKGQFHHKHSHPNSYISGVFYVKTNAKKDKIWFHKDGYEQIKLETENYNVWNSDSWWLPVQNGRLLLFPSCLSHEVHIVDELRVSLSFNTFIQGDIGSERNATQLKYTKEHLFPL